MKLHGGVLRSRFGHRLLILFICCAVLPTVAVALLALRDVTHQLDQQAQARLHESAKAIGLAIVERLQLLESELPNRPLSRGPGGPRAAAAEEIDQGIRERFVALERIDASRLGPAARRHLASGQALLSTVHRPGLPPRIYLANRVDLEDESRGLVVGEISPSFLWGVPYASGLSAGTALIILDDSNQVLYNSQAEFLALPETLGWQLSGSSSGKFEWESSAGPRVASYWSIFLKPSFGKTKWTIVLSEPKDDVVAPIAAFKSTFLPLILLSLLTVVLLSIHQIRRSLTPLRALQEGSRRIAMRDFDSRVSIDSGDEFEQLATDFNTMATRLGRQFNALATAAEIDRAVLSAMDTDTIVNTVLTQAMDVCPCDAIGVGLLDPLAAGSTRIYTAAARDPSSRMTEVVEISPNDLATLRAQAEPLLVAAGDIVPSYLMPLAARGARAFVVLPLFVETELLGVIMLGDVADASRGAEDLTQARRLADQVAVALSNACMITSLAHERTQLERRTHELSRANEILREEIGERERAEKALQESEQQLRQSQKMEAIGTLAGGVAHDFNNLLTVISSYSEMAIDELDAGAPMRADLEQVFQAARRAAALTRQLLAFSRKQVMRPEVVDLNQLVAAIETMLRRLLGAGIEIRRVEGVAPALVKADPGQLDQVLMNLAVNARDAMPAGGRLTLETASVRLDAVEAARLGVEAGDWVVLSVQDSGTGMDEATRARIFEPFFTTKEPGKGTGLGLSTVYGIVQQSGGCIAVESELARGTTFKVYLPAIESVEETIEAEPNRSRAGTGSETVLLVEDEEAVRVLVDRLLRRCGYSVLTASHAGEALLLAEQHQGPIHLLLTDVVMPLMSGRQLAERLRRGRAEMRVLYMSGYTNDGAPGHGLLEAGTDLLQKPFGPDALTRKVREVLDGTAQAAVAPNAAARRGALIPALPRQPDLKGVEL
jgi:signal transduction histidine kinase/FixJ family two-component response regulator